MILLIDGNHLLHRILHVPSQAVLKTSDGRPTGGVFGFVRVVRRTCEDFDCEAAGIVWDSKYSVRRLAVYPEYKAGRGDYTDPKSQDYYSLFFNQKQVLATFLTSLGIPGIQVQGREADDVLYNLSRRPEHDWLIMTEDYDLLQAVASNVKVWRPIAQSREEDPIDTEGNLKHVVTIENFKAYTKGVKWGYYEFYKTLVGDGSDNVPGILGDTTAKMVIEMMEEPTLDAVRIALKTALLVPKARKVAQAIEKWAEIDRNYQVLDLSQEILTEDELAYCKDQIFHRPKIDDLKVMEICQDLEFKSITKNLVQWLIPFRKMNG